MHPNAITELILSGALQRQATLAALDCEGAGEAGVLTMMRGTRELLTAELPRELCDATAARIAIMAGIPLGGSGERMGRLRARVGGEIAEIIAAVRRTPHGLAVELRPLSYGGRPVLVTESHALARCQDCGQLCAAREPACTVCGGALVPVQDDARVGGTVGCYSLDALAGSGGMGMVYFGTHALIGRKIALKVLHEGLCGDADMAGRFLIEARAASRLHHPGIVDISDYGVLDDGRPYLVMERLDGEPLAERFRRDKVLSPAPPSCSCARSQARWRTRIGTASSTRISSRPTSSCSTARPTRSRSSR